MSHAPFVVLYADRLVASLTSETGLSADDARALAQDVLERAYDRGSVFASPGETYAWLRVAARRRAADVLRTGTVTTGADADESWATAAEAADTALLGTRSGAARLVATLPPEQREVLRLRYVDGLRPAAIASQLGLPVEDVEARIAAAREAATRALHPLAPAPRTARLEPVWAAARRTAYVAAAVAVAAALSGLPDAARTPPAHGAQAAPAPVSVAPVGRTPVVAAPPASDARRAVDIVAVRVLGGVAVADPAVREPGAGTPDRPGATCPAKPCLGKPGTLPNDYDQLRVQLPQPLQSATGESDLVVEQEHLPVCSMLPDAPSGTAARCVPGRH